MDAREIWTGVVPGEGGKGIRWRTLVMFALTGRPFVLISLTLPFVKGVRKRTGWLSRFKKSLPQPPG